MSIAHPSANTKTISLSGNENVIGDTITIPKAVKMLATAKSIARNGR
jgi:hypothetical protein